MYWIDRSHTDGVEKITPQGTPLAAMAVSRAGGSIASSAWLTAGCSAGTSRYQR